MTDSAAASPFTEAEVAYLDAQYLGRLATVHPDGTVQVSPVGIHYNARLGTVDVAGMRLAGTRKYRNVAANGRVAIVVDDLASVQPWRVRCLEIRGAGEALTADAVDPADLPEGPHWDGALIRIHPRRIISFGVQDADRPVQEQRAHNRDVVPA